MGTLAVTGLNAIADFGNSNSSSIAAVTAMDTYRGPPDAASLRRRFNRRRVIFTNQCVGCLMIAIADEREAQLR
jgi:hypothetical protein